MKTKIIDYHRPLLMTIPGWNSPGHYMRYYVSPAEKMGYLIYCYNHGWMLAKSMRNPGIARRIVNFVEFWHRISGGTVVAITHSNGTELGWRVADLTPWLSGIVSVNGALDADIIFPDRLQFVHNWYSPSDKAVSLASFLPGNRWGKFGAVPYDGVSAMVKNFNKEEDFDLISDSHSDQYTERDLRQFFIQEQLNEMHKEITVSMET